MEMRIGNSTGTFPIIASNRRLEAPMHNSTQSHLPLAEQKNLDSSHVASERRNIGTVAVDLFSYSDYRKFLMDRFLELQSRFPDFSQRRLAKNSGILNPGFFNEVIKGRRNLTSACALKFSVGLRLTEEEKEFFVTMVKHAHAVDPTLKQLAENRLRNLRINLRKENAGASQALEYSQGILRELADHWMTISAHFEILSESSGDSPPVFFKGGRNELRSSLESLTDVREVATNQWEQCSNIRERVFQISMLVKPVIKDEI